jgi:hypothetical protein
MPLPTFTVGRLRASELNEITAALNVASADNADATTRTTTSTTFTTTLSAANICGTSFVAPPSGIVAVHFAVFMFNSGSNFTQTSPSVRAGGTVGSGTVHLASADARSISHVGTAGERPGAMTRVTGLTAGATYNVALEHRVGAGTGSFQNREVTVIPLAA